MHAMSRSSQQSTPSYMAATTTTSSPPSTTTTSSSASARSSTGHRYSTAHSNSSAFSASANPNEDWTKISDLAERRRIQNRIAQRNYRKKLKRRLEDLEKKAASTESSPEPQPAPQPELKYPAPTSQAHAHVLEAPHPPQPQMMPMSAAAPAAVVLSPPASVEPIARPSSASSSGYLPATSNSFDDSTIFTPHYRHTYTASPPIMSYPTPPMSNDSYSQYSPTPSYTGGYAASPPPAELPPHFHSPALSSARSAISSGDGNHSIKAEFFEEDISQFQLSFSPLESQIGGQFVDCAPPPPSAFSHDPTICAPLAPDFDALDPLDGFSPDFWSLCPEPPHFISV